MLGLSPADVAARLGTSSEVVIALESGHVAALPPWPESARVVGAYLSAANIDARPVLSTLKSAVIAAEGQRRGGALAPPRLARGTAPAKSAARRSLRERMAPGLLAIRLPLSSLQIGGRMPRLLSRLAAVYPGARLPRPSWRTTLSLGVPVLLLVAVTQTRIADVAAASMPAPIGNALRGASEHVRVLLAPKFEGLTWIDVADPRSRRADKLPSAKN